MTANVHLRGATPDDCELIFQLITELAIYEREPQAVETTPAVIRGQLESGKCPFECLIAELAGEPARFALFFQNYSTWKGRPGLYLEDLFVRESARKSGVGGALLVALARIAVERGYGRMEWSVLDWNQLAIDFYKSLGAFPMSDWTTFRLTGEPLRELAAR